MRLNILNLSTHCPSIFVILTMSFQSRILWFLFDPQRFDFIYCEGYSICSPRGLSWVCLQRKKSFLGSCKQKDLGTQLIGKSKEINSRMSLQKQLPMYTCGGFNLIFNLAKLKVYILKESWECIKKSFSFNPIKDKIYLSILWCNI